MTDQPGPSAGKLRLIPATPDTIGDVLTVLNDAASWLRTDKGIHQWPTRFVAGERRADQLVAEAVQGHVHVMYRGDTPLATCTVTPWCDPDFAHGWPDTTNQALYVLRLATTRRARHEGLRLGAALLHYASCLVMARGWSRLRLDCSRDNAALHRYYESRGFQRVGEVTVPGRRSGALFEQKIT